MSSTQETLEPLDANSAVSRRKPSRKAGLLTGAPPLAKVSSCWVSPRARVMVLSVASR